MALFHSKVFGIVQGVGFRPFVSRLAAEFNIYGSVCNKGPYVEVYAQGEETAVLNFLQAIEQEPPEREKFQERCQKESGQHLPENRRFAFIFLIGIVSQDHILPAAGRIVSSKAAGIRF